MPADDAPPPATVLATAMARLRSGWFALALLVLAALLNLLRADIPGVMPVHLGGIAWFFVALRFGAARGALAGALVGLTDWPAPDGILFACEAAGVAWLLRRRGLAGWQAIALFWPLAGLALLALLRPDLRASGAQVLLQAGLVAALNAWFSLTVAQLLLRIEHDATIDAAPYSLHALLADRLAAFAVLPLALTGFLAVGALLRDFEDEQQEAMQRLATVAAEQLDEGLFDQQTIIGYAASIVPLPLDTRAEHALGRVLEQQPWFISLLATDADGVIRAAVARPDSGLDIERSRGSGAQDRSYFRVPRATGKPHVSDVFRGRGMGNDLLVAIAVPVRTPEGRFAGVIEGSIRLDTAGLRLQTTLDNAREGDDFIVVDRQQQIIFSSLERLPPGSRFDMPAAGPAGPGGALYLAERQQLMLEAGVERAGWRLLLVHDNAPWARTFTVYALLALGAGLLLVQSMRLLARRFSHRLADPLSALAQQVRGVDIERSAGALVIAVPAGTAEMRSLAADVTRMVQRNATLYRERDSAVDAARELNRRLEESNRLLEERVRERTAELLAAQQRSEELAQAKGRFLANMSHEMRTPLTAILGYTEALRRGEIAADGSAATLETIHRNGEHLLEVINQLLDHARIERGELALERLPCDAARLIGEVCTLFAQNAVARGLRLEAHGLDALPALLLCDPTRLRQILLNLVGNAMKFTGAGAIDVTAGYDAARGELGIAVRDTGIGMDAATVERLFQPFVQADASTTRRFGGTGLGLYISRELARAMGGEIRVESRAGAGSCFELRLAAPVASAPPPATVAAGGAMPRLRGRVLLAEDQQIIQQLVGMMVRATGATVETADDGGQALERALAEPWDLLLLDMQMPVLDGIEVFRRLRARGFRTPVVALTANISDEDRAIYAQEGFDAWEGKPIRRESFLAMLARFLPAEPPAA